MKWLLPILIILSVQSAMAQPLAPQGLDPAWPGPNQSDAQALSQLLDLLKTDELSRVLIQTAEAQLASHGIHHLSSILKFCASPAGGAQASAQMPVRLAETHALIPGKPPTPWSAKTVSDQQKAYRSKTIQTPYVEYLLIEDQPYICLDRQSKLINAAAILAHELVHFTQMDPFQDQEELIQGVRLETFAEHFTENRVLTTGGELAAYRVGVPVEMRLRAAAGITSPISGAQFFDAQGNLKDSAGFQDWVMKIYMTYYQDPQTKASVLAPIPAMLDLQIATLQERALPALKAKLENMAPALAELKRLTDLKKEFQSLK